MIAGKPMKVILSIDPVRFPLTGIGRYTFELAKHLKEIADIEPLRFLSGYRFAPLPEPTQASVTVGTPIACYSCLTRIKSFQFVVYALHTCRIYE